MYKPKIAHMKFYQNKFTDEIIGIDSMREVIDLPTEQSTKLGYDNYSYHVVYDMICPNRLIPNGVKSFCITRHYLIKYYKRIRKEIALEKYPQFRQYVYSDLERESKELGISKLDIIKKQRF